MGNTKIEWADSTLNPQMGCDGCELWNPKTDAGTCYAAGLTRRYAGRPGWPEMFARPRLFLDRFQQLEKWPDLRGKERPAKPWLNGLPRLVFMCDMGDPWTESLPLDWLAPHLDYLESLPHVLIWLTKRTDRARQFFEAHRAPENFWLLTSVTSEANYARIAHLIATPGIALRGVSHEPALGPVNFRAFPMLDGDHLDACLRWFDHDNDEYSGIDWVIVGGESGPGARPMHPDWARAARDQCVAAGVPFFFKQFGEWLPTSQLGPEHLDDWVEPEQTGEITELVWQGKEGDGRPVKQFQWADGSFSFRVGKRAAGRLLDRREWNEFPE